jgi:hypothetical protein
MIEKNNLEQHYKDLAERLELLRGVFSEASARPFADLFDEFIQEQEYGLALDTLCDYLVESGRPLSKEDLGQIEHLHTAMEMDPERVAGLKKAK